MRTLFWQAAIAVALWLPILLVAHHSGILELSLIDRIERRAAVMLGLSQQGPSAQAETSPCLGAAAVAPVRAPLAYRTTRDVNVRRGPGTQHERLGRLPGGQEVTVIGRSPSGRWLLIAIDGETRCFVSADYLAPVS